MKSKGYISSFAKIVILIFHLVTAISGALITLFGVIEVINEKSGVPLYSNGFSMGGLAIGVGCVTFLFSFFGCFAAYKRDTKGTLYLVLVYSVILVLFLLGQGGMGAFAFLKVDGDTFESNIRSQIEELYLESTNPKNSFENFANLQSFFLCCGVNGPSDYSQGTLAFPPSCCEGTPDLCSQPFELGCVDTYVDVIRGNLLVLSYISIGFAILEFTCTIFTFLVMKWGKREPPEEFSYYNDDSSEETSRRRSSTSL